VRVLLANVGNLDEGAETGCPSTYRGALCSYAEEAAIADRITELEPDILILEEVFDHGRCPQQTEENDVDLLCTGEVPDSEAPYSIQRLVGSGYTIVCDADSHFSCLAVREDWTIEQCAASEGFCYEDADTAPIPEECGDRASLTTVSRAKIQSEHGDFGVIFAHPLNGTATDDACRLAQYEQAFETMAVDEQVLIAGDMNNDPYRFPDLFPSSVYWHEHVGETKRFQAHSVDGSPPTPTWLDTMTLDYILSDFLAGGSCDIIGVGSNPLDYPYNRMDHRGVSCTFDWPTQ